jgi:hypothetical protein
VCVYIYKLQVCMCVYICVYIDQQVCVYIYITTSMYVCIYMCMYIYIYMRERERESTWYPNSNTMEPDLCRRMTVLSAVVLPSSIFFRHHRLTALSITRRKIQKIYYLNWHVFKTALSLGVPIRGWIYAWAQSDYTTLGGESSKVGRKGRLTAQRRRALCSVAQV